MQFAVDDLVWEYRLNTESHVTHLFSACHRSLYLFMLYLEVLLHNCTYKTTWFGLPLKDMVCMTGVKLSFLVGYALIKSEGDKSFCRVINCLSLYTFSVSGVVVTNCDLALIKALPHVFPSS